MDFDSLLAQAGSNARKNNKKLKEADQQLESERRRNLERLAQQKQLEKAELKRRLPPKHTSPPEPKFVIPKKKIQQTSVDKSKLTAFLERQERTKQERVFQKQQEKEELIRLRIAASGGKANKKIAKHFGKSPLELQRRYAHNPDYEDTLIRQAEREQEEHDKLSALYRQGVYRALNKKDEVCAIVGKPIAKPRNFDVERPLSKKLSSSTVSKPPAVSSTRSNAKAAELELKKRKSGMPSEDFRTLMQKAQMNREIDPNAFEFTAPSDIPKKQRPIVEGVGVSAGLNLAYASKRNLRDIHSPEYTSVEKTNKMSRKEPFNGDQLSLKKSKLSSMPESRKFIYDERREALPKSSSSAKQLPPMPKVKAERIIIDPEVGPMKEKRYLPGDIRAKHTDSANGTSQKRYLPNDIRSKQTSSDLNLSKSSATQRNGQLMAGTLKQMYIEETRPSTAAKRAGIRSQVERMPSKSSATIRERYSNDDDMESALARKRRELEEMERAFANRERQHPSTKEIESQRLVKLQLQQREERMRYEAPRYSNSRIERKRSRSPAIRYANYSETDEDEEEENNEEEYDSDMADFIDDSTVDDLQREDFEESLRMINPRYDKKKWMMREKMISDRQMDARFRDIESEERHSARVAIYEDLAEARRGSKALA